MVLLQSLHPLPYHCCTAIVAVIIAAVMWRSSLVSFLLSSSHAHGCLLHNRSKGLLPAGVVGEKATVPNEGGGKVID